MSEVEVQVRNNQEDIKPVESDDTEKEFKIPAAKLKDVNVTDYMKYSIDKVAVAEGFVDYDVQVNHGSSIGDGFVGLIFKADIQERNSDKILRVVVKSPPEGARRTDMKSMILFEREVYLYNVVLPTFVKFQKEKKIDPSIGFFNFPKCFFAEYDEEKDEAIIIMEDLRLSGFELWDKFKPTDFDHTKLVVTALGKFHALSFALKAQQPEVFEEFKKINDLMSELMLDENFGKMLSSSVVQAADTLDESNVEGRARVINAFEDIPKVMKEVVDPKAAEPYSIVTHGDCWSNNFMYRHQDESPTDIVLLDWQISRYSSPVLDLLYFFFICTGGEMRAKHFEELIEIYHNSLSEFLTALGGDASIQFPKSVLKDHLKNYGRFGILMASMIVPLLTTKNEELPDFDYMAENTKSPEVMEKMMKNFMKTNKLYEGRMRPALEDALRYGYL